MTDKKISRSDAEKHTSSGTKNKKTFLKTRDLLFFLFAALGTALFFKPFKDLLLFSLHEDTYSHIPLIPLISGYFLYRKRQAIFSGAKSKNSKKSFLWGIALILLGAAPWLTGTYLGTGLGENDYLSLMVFSSVIFYIGGFVLFYGVDAFKAGAFPLLFLFFMVPIPGLILHKIILFLRIGSSDMASGLFKLAGVPFLRDGFVFHFPGLSIRVARECSGIRSSMALFIVGVIMGQLFLTRCSYKMVLLLAVVPIAAFKNALRIATLSILSLYVSPAFMTSGLHRDGGIIFFIIGVYVLWSFLRLLRRFEKAAVYRRTLPDRFKR